MTGPVRLAALGAVTRRVRLAALGAVAVAAALPPGRASGASRPIPAASAFPALKQAAEAAPPPLDGDRDRDRIVRLQESLREIIHGGALRRTRVGIRVMDAANGRLFFAQRSGVLMDPASNQKVLATTTALVRLGADWRFRTELSGPLPNADGIIVGDVVLRGSGDPTLRSGDLDALATALARRGVRGIIGAVVADPRRIGADEPVADEEGDAGEEAASAADASRDTPVGKLSPRVPLVVNHGLMLVRVRPGAEVGLPAEVTTTPADPSFVIHNEARTKLHRHSRITVRLKVAGARIEVDVDGRIAPGRPGLLFRRRVPQQALYAAALMRASLGAAGIVVRDDARVEAVPPPKPGRAVPLLAAHDSAPLAILLRKINKDSENDYAERVLEAAGAEVYGGAPTQDKGVRLLREVIGELGLPPGSYVPRNGSGLGHANRITADAMAALLRTLYLDPRVGPELLQSLSVGGIDGTTRNRFKGTLAAERVRAKTGTLRGKSCLSGLVGDGPDVLAFSILVEGLRGRSLAAVRGAQVGCVNAMMRYVYEARGGPLAPGAAPGAPAGTDLEAGEEVTEGDEEIAPRAPPEGPGQAHEDPVDALLRKERERTAGTADPPRAAPGAPPRAAPGH